MSRHMEPKTKSKRWRGARLLKSDQVQLRLYYRPLSAVCDGRAPCGLGFFIKRAFGPPLKSRHFFSLREPEGESSRPLNNTPYFPHKNPS